MEIFKLFGSIFTKKKEKEEFKLSPAWNEFPNTIKETQELVNDALEQLNDMKVDLNFKSMLEVNEESLRLLRVLLYGTDEERREEVNKIRKESGERFKEK